MINNILNFIYLFNPFPEIVMCNVVDALVQSIRKSERELVIIYNTPKCHNLFVNQGCFKKMGTYTGAWGGEIAIYSNRDFNDSRLTANRHLNRL